MGGGGGFIQNVVRKVEWESAGDKSNCRCGMNVTEVIQYIYTCYKMDVALPHCYPKLRCQSGYLSRLYISH